MLLDSTPNITHYFSVNMMDFEQKKESLKQEISLTDVVEQHTILNDLFKAINSTMSVQEVMAAIITKSIQTIGADQGTIMLVEENSPELLKTLSCGIQEEQKGEIYKIGEQLTAWMFNNQKPILCNDYNNDERFRILNIKNSGVSSILSVPMILQDKLIGVINLFNKCNTRLFSENDQKLMCVIATQSASFLGAAKSFEQVQETKGLLQKQTIQLQNKVDACYEFSGIIGQSAKIKQIQQELKSIVKTPASVLILGETGTGKELVAKTIHYNSDRKDKPFVDVNSSAIPENLVESEFFGIEEGVATGVNKRIGLFEQANGGTLFIDEIGDMSITSQAKILRVLQERQLRRVGSNHNINIDIRIIAASNKNLKKEIAKGKFRKALYYCINTFEINLPPLRKRKDDIPLLAEHFMKLYAQKMGKIIQGFSDEVLEVLVNYNWFGNVRELANVIEQAVILTNDTSIQITDLPADIRNQITRI